MLLTVGHNWSGAGASAGAGGLFCWDVVQLYCVRRIKVDSYYSVTLHYFLNTSHGCQVSILIIRVCHNILVWWSAFWKGLNHQNSTWESIQYLINWKYSPLLSKLHQIFMSPSKQVICHWPVMLRWCQGTSCWHCHMQLFWQHSNFSLSRSHSIFWHNMNRFLNLGSPSSHR